MPAASRMAMLEPTPSLDNDYADYLQLNRLLTLQSPRSSQPDEVLFITFHQMSEMVFALVIRELATLTGATPLPSSAWQQPLDRICGLIRLLVFQMRVFAETLDRRQFLGFRGALGQASGLQSVQFRMIELMSATLQSLAATRQNPMAQPAAGPAQGFAQVHWRDGWHDGGPCTSGLCPAAGLEDMSGDLANLARRMVDRNLAYRYSKLPETERAEPALRRLLAEYDRLINRVWGGLHLRCARMMLGGPHWREDDGAAHADIGTGGTNWRHYLAGQLDRSFFPELQNAA